MLQSLLGRRSARVTAGVLGFVLAFGMGTAVAAWITRAPIEGSFSSGTTTFMAWRHQDTRVTEQKDGACSFDADGRKLQLTVDLAPGGACTFQSLIASDMDLRISGVRVDGLPDGWTATLTHGCGDLVGPQAGGGVSIRLARGPDAGDEAGTFGENSGVEAVRPEDFTPEMCAGPQASSK